MLVIKQHGIEMDMAEYLLREIKHARTKIALMKAFIEHLRHSSFEDISVKDACKRAEIPYHVVLYDIRHLFATSCCSQQVLEVEHMPTDAVHVLGGDVTQVYQRTVVVLSSADVRMFRYAGQGCREVGDTTTSDRVVIPRFRVVRERFHGSPTG